MKISQGMKINVTSGSNFNFIPLVTPNNGESYFADGTYLGFLLDPSRIAENSMNQTFSGAGPVSDTDGDKVTYAKDFSGGNNHFFNAASTTAPNAEIGIANSSYGIFFDAPTPSAVRDSLAKVPTWTNFGSDLTIAIALKNLSSNNSVVFRQDTSGYGSNNTVVMYHNSISDGSISVTLYDNEMGWVSARYTPEPAPWTNYMVIEFDADVAGNNAISGWWINGTDIRSLADMVVTDHTGSTVNMSTESISLAARPGAPNAYWDGVIYYFMYINRKLATQERKNLEAYMAGLLP